MKRVSLILLSAILLIASSACTGDIETDVSGKENSELIAEYISETDDLEADREEASLEGKETPSEEVVSDEPDSEENISDISSEEVMSEESPAEQEPEFTVQVMDEIYYAIKSVNVRKGPSTKYDRIGSLNKGQEVHVTGVADTGWFRIDYNGDVGYFADSYAVDKVTYQALLEAEAKKAEEKKQEEKTQEEIPAVAPIESGGVKSDLVALMNGERSSNGIGSLTEDATLNQLAQIRAQEIYTKFDHTRPDGTSCFTILSGVSYMTAGENIAAGQASAAEVMADWMNSPGHRANILNASYNKVGIGYFTTADGYGTYWVQLFTD